MSEVLSNDATSQLQALYAEMQPRSLYPLWEVLGALVTPTPRSPAQVHRWRYTEARDYLLRAGDLISAAKAERRVLIMENPGLAGTSSVTPSLYAGLQLILPGGGRALPSACAMRAAFRHGRRRRVHRGGW